MILILFFPIKLIWIAWACYHNRSFEAEKQDILQRKNWLVEKIVVQPQHLLDKMPNKIGKQFQGEWALYSCSMLAKALTNITRLYLEARHEALSIIERLIHLVNSTELRSYDTTQWREDALESLSGNKSHVPYLSYLAWIIGNYKLIGGDKI